MAEKLLFELSRPGRRGVIFPAPDVPLEDPASLLPPSALRKEPPPLPEVSEVDVVRHFVRMSILNHHVDKGFYPLGSCTMKYNPKLNEAMARLPGFACLHPLQAERTVQGALRLMYELAGFLQEIAGMDAVTLQPAAGAQGEFTGLLIARAYLEGKGEQRRTVLIPDSAHGTNPASVRLAGFEAVTLASGKDGLVDLEALRQALGPQTAVVMLTNPNTLGKFETQIQAIAEAVHEAGALLYLDGANLNALLGIVRPGEMGFDIVHFNLHKTFSTPHGGGGPGAGPLGVKAFLRDFLPVPLVARRPEGTYYLDHDLPRSVGRVHSFFGNFGVLVRAYTYIRMHGPEGLRTVSENAILNANYLIRRLEPHYHNPYPGTCFHEGVLSGIRQKERGVKTLDIAKRLLDYGVYAPTIYFPLIVPEALMIEPTETESKESVDQFAEAMIAIAREVEETPEVVQGAPHTTPVRRLDEVKAAREPDLRWRG